MTFQEGSKAVRRVAKPQKVSFVLEEKKKVYTKNQSRLLESVRQTDEVYVL